MKNYLLPIFFAIFYTTSASEYLESTIKEEVRNKVIVRA